MTDADRTDRERLDELMAEVVPLSGDEDLSIAGISDEEWRQFVEALDE